MVLWCNWLAPKVLILVIRVQVPVEPLIGIHLPKKKLQQSKKKKFKKMYSINTNRKNKMQSKDCSRKPTAKDITKGSNIKHAGKIQQTKIEKRKINKKLGRIYIYIKNIHVILQ